MKNKDPQKIVLSKCQNGDTAAEIHCDLNGGIGLRIIRRWCQMTSHSGSIALSTPPGCLHFVRTKTNIQKVKYHLIMSKEKNISSKTINGALVFPTEVFDE